MIGKYYRQMQLMSEETKLPMSDLCATFNGKVFDYTLRDNRNGKHIDWMRPKEQNDRAYMVMFQYAQRKKLFRE